MASGPGGDLAAGPGLLLTLTAHGGNAKFSGSGCERLSPQAPAPPARPLSGERGL